MNSYFLWIETFPPRRWESLKVTKATSSLPGLLTLPSLGMQLHQPALMLAHASLGWAFGDGAASHPHSCKVTPINWLVH